MSSETKMKSLARAIEIVGERPFHKTLPSAAVENLKRAAGGTTVEQDKTAARLRKNSRAH